MQGVRFNIHDAVVCSDITNRSSGQIILTTQKAIYACMLTAKPRLLEPIYLIEIQVMCKIQGNVITYQASFTFAMK